MDKNKIGLALGSFFAGVSLIWALLVSIIPDALQTFLDWIFNLHGVAPIVTITSLTLMNILILIIVKFLIGFLIGWVFALIFNYTASYSKTKKKK